MSFALPIFARCERPRTASVRAERLQPGRLAQGPEEKCGTSGRTVGIALLMIYPSRWAPLGGEGCPAAGHTERAARRQAAADRGPRHVDENGRCGSISARTYTRPSVGQSAWSSSVSPMWY